MNRLILLSAFIVFSTASFAGDDVLSWLDRMSDATKSLNYEGTFVYLHDGELETMRIIHGSDEDGEHEKLVSLNGAAREIIRDNDYVTCILPDSKAVVVDKSRPKKSFTTSLPVSFDNLKDNYVFQMDGEERIAGRAARIISIKPRDNHRYGYRLWIDTVTGLLLKMDQVNEQGRALEQMMYTELTVVDHIDASRILPSISGQEYTWSRQQDEVVKQEKTRDMWLISKAPKGFMLSHSNIHKMPGDKRSVSHMVLTDGMASVSVYIDNVGHNTRKKMLQGTSKMGAVSAFGRFKDNYHITVVGEVPPETVMMIGNSIEKAQHAPHK
jgi:sigma-E factor negative regulatory protein RseB